MEDCNKSVNHKQIKLSQLLMKIYTELDYKEVAEDSPDYEDYEDYQTQ